MPAEERPFFLRERVMGDTAVVELHGEIDIVAAPYLTGCLDSLTRVISRRLSWICAE